MNMNNIKVPNMRLCLLEIILSTASSKPLYTRH